VKTLSENPARESVTHPREQGQKASGNTSACGGSEEGMKVRRWYSAFPRLTAQNTAQTKKGWSWALIQSTTRAREGPPERQTPNNFHHFVYNLPDKACAIELHVTNDLRRRRRATLVERRDLKEGASTCKIGGGGLTTI